MGDSVDHAIDQLTGEAADIEKTEEEEEAEATAEATEEEEETSEKVARKRVVRPPSDFRNHVLAIMLNKATDNVLGLKEGTSFQAEWGQSWVSLCEYYTGVPDHPIMFVLGAGIMLAIAYFAQRSEKEGDKSVEKRRKMADVNAEAEQETGVLDGVLN